MHWATMPKATVHEDCQPAARKGYIDRATGIVRHAIVDSKAKTLREQRPPNGFLQIVVSARSTSHPCTGPLIGFEETSSDELFSNQSHGNERFFVRFK
jgi:hypothetical protein